MAILRIQHIGVVVRDLEAACAHFERTLGLKARDFRDDQGRGMQLDARVLLGNECWLHLVQNWNPESRVFRFLEEKGEGLEHIALETDDIEADVAHLREIGVPIWEDRILDANDGYEAFVFPDQLPGLTVELIQSHDRSWFYPPEQVGRPISSTMELVRLQHSTTTHKGSFAKPCEKRCLLNLYIFAQIIITFLQYNNEKNSNTPSLFSLVYFCTE